MTQLELKRRKLRGKGNKATPQRMSIIKAIDRMKAQFTPQELYEEIRKNHPEIGLVTVYRTLKLLAESGMVCRMGHAGSAQSYARRPEEHHHHLICTACNKVVNIMGCGVEGLEEKLSRETGFVISEHHLEFMGLCQDCQKLASEETEYKGVTG
jgi:Fur family ferric uptake transcriptional regulator